jgi:hypothetical protein
LRAEIKKAEEATNVAKQSVCSSGHCCQFTEYSAV